MSMSFQCIQTHLNRNRFATQHLVLLAIVLGVPQIGCGPSEPQEISASTSGYKPKAGESKDGESKTSGTMDASDKSKMADNVGATVGPSSVGDANGLPTASSPPAFQPGKLDPKIASKPYMTLELGNLNGAKPLMEFLNTSSRAAMELLADGRKKLLTKEIVLERGMVLSRMKLEASERLEKLAADADEKTAATAGKLEAYSQMASFGDVAASDSLRELSQQEMNNTDKRVAQLAKSISLSMLVSDVDSGTAKPEELVNLAKTILTSGKDLTSANLSAMAQAVEVLSKRSDVEAAIQLAKNVEEGFRENAEPQLALGAWDLYASRIQETSDAMAIIQSDSPADQDPARARAAIDALMAKIPSPWTSFFLVQMAIKVEYSGRPLIAKEMVEVAKTQIDNLKDPEAKEELDRNCKQFMSRVGILNKPMNLSELVDVSGKPLDLARYKGKVVLVDFWATWCGPCLQEIPNIEDALLTHGKNGFEVIGINLDDDRANLDSFLQSKKLPWSTYVSSKPDAVGFSTPLAKEIGISSIPFIAIIGKDGNVAGIHVRGRKIIDKIVELLAKE